MKPPGNRPKMQQHTDRLPSQEIPWTREASWEPMELTIDKKKEIDGRKQGSHERSLGSMTRRQGISSEGAGAASFSAIIRQSNPPEGNNQVKST